MGNDWCLPPFVQLAASATEDKSRYDDEEEGCCMTNYGPMVQCLKSNEMASPILVTLA